MNKTVVFDENGARVLNCKPIIYNKEKVIINPVTYPDCPQLFWKKMGDRIIEMDRREKLKALSSKVSKNYWYLYLYYQPEIIMVLLVVILIYLFVRH